MLVPPLSPRSSFSRSWRVGVGRTWWGGSGNGLCCQIFCSQLGEELPSARALQIHLAKVWEALTAAG